MSLSAAQAHSQVPFLPTDPATSGFYSLPPFPGTHKNDAGFNLTFPVASSYYNVQLKTSTIAQPGPNGTYTIINETAWTAPMPPTPYSAHPWPAIWEFSDAFLAHLPAESNEPMYSGPCLALLRTDPASGRSGVVGAVIPMSPRRVVCDARQYPKRPNNHTCSLDMGVVSLPSNVTLERQPTPGDAYFVALLNYTSSPNGSQVFENYISVTEHFSLKNTSTMDPDRPKWAAGAGRLAVPWVLVAQLALLWALL